MNDCRDNVRRVAASLGLLDPQGRLVPLDSLMVIDFVIALQEEFHVRVPATQLQSGETFASIDSVATMLATLL
jgi:hypothetical protein